MIEWETGKHLLVLGNVSNNRKERKKEKKTKKGRKKEEGKKERSDLRKQMEVTGGKRWSPC